MNISFYPDARMHFWNVELAYCVVGWKKHFLRHKNLSEMWHHFWKRWVSHSNCTLVNVGEDFKPFVPTSRNSNCACVSFNKSRMHSRPQSRRCTASCSGFQNNREVRQAYKRRALGSRMKANDTSKSLLATYAILSKKNTLLTFYSCQGKARQGFVCLIL